MQRKILIVDDNETNRIILRKILGGVYEVLEAEGGREAIEVMSREFEDLSAVLLDLVMPEVDGYEVLRRVRATPVLAGIPVIVATGSTDSEAENKALALGANDFVTKPYNPTTIKHRLWNMINLRESAAMVNRARRDELTGLLNRSAFLSDAANMIDQQEEGYYVLSCMDIDNFKSINDQYGAEVGDEILKGIACVLRRDCEYSGGIACRITADNFAVLFPRRYAGDGDADMAHHKADLDDELLLPVTVSVGRYIVDDRDLSVSTMYDRAMIAQATVKGRYDTHLAVYDENMRLRMLREQEIISEMNSALAEGQFEVWFQPQYNHSTGALIGSEALVRWRHPVKGLIPPGEFIPLFERCGFIYELDKFVWTRTCEYLRKWTDQGRDPLPVSVNISREDFYREDMIDILTGLIDSYGLSVDLLRLEITESAFAQSGDRVVDAAKRLVDLGFTVEIDDFGSGYSSLNTLKDVPAQVVKLDMRFLEDTGKANRGGNILESVVRMVKWLGMSIISEGVETLSQAEYLKSIGCSYVQGYLYARPMPAEDYEKLSRTVDKEEKMLVMETVENLDNNSFWDPDSMDTLIFNSYAGGACIFEYHNGEVEMLRATEHFVQMFGSVDMTVSEAQTIPWSRHMDEATRAAIRSAIKESREHDTDVAGEFVFLNLPGCPEKTYLRARVRVLATAGDRYLLYCNADNITAQREAERQEHALTRQMTEMMNDTPGGFLRISVKPDGSLHTVYANETFCGFRGMDMETLLSIDGEDAYRSVYPEDLPLVRETIQHMLSTGETCNIKYRVKSANGEYTPFSVFGRITRNQDGQAFINAYFTDRTEQEKLEALRRDLLDNLPCGAGMYEVVGSDIKILHLNRRYEELIGRPAVNVGSSTAFHSVHPDDKPLMLGNISESLTHGGYAEFDLRLLHASGEYRPFHIVTKVVEASEDRYAVCSTISPISPQELTIRETMPFILSAIMASSTELSFAKDKDFRYLCCSKPFAKMVGLGDERDIIGKTDYDIFDAATADRFRADDEKLLSEGRPLIDYIEAIPSDDGVQHYSSTSKYILRDSVGSIIGLYGAGRDVTEYRSAFQQLKLLTDNLPGGIASYVRSPLETKLLYFNDGYCAILGYGREEYLSLAENGVRKRIFDEDMPLLDRQLSALYRDGTAVDCVCRVHIKGGGYKWVNIKGVITERVSQLTYINVLMTDVTEQKDAAEALRIHQEELGLALAKMSRIIAEYDVAAATLTLPEEYAKAHQLPRTVTGMPRRMGQLNDMDPDMFTAYCDFYDAIAQGREPEPVEILRRTPEGTARWERFTAYTVFDGDGRPVKALVSADDTTEQHRRYELERNRPKQGEKDLVAYALFDLSTGERLEYANGDGSPVAPGHDSFLNCKAVDLERLIPDPEERQRYLELNNISALLKRFSRGESQFILDYRRRLASGQAVWVRTFLRLVSQPGTGHVLLFKFSYDITGQKLSELTYGVLVDAGYDYVTRISARTGAFSAFSGSGRGNLPPDGEDADAAARELIEREVFPEDREMVLAYTTVEGMKANLKDRDQFQFTFRTLDENGALRFKRITQYYMDRTLDVIIMTREDVTQIVEKEAEKNEALSAALKAANQASQAKTSFLSRMSHELRTPMNAIIGLAALSAQDLEDPKAMEDNIGKIGMSARYLLSLINDILEMSRIESGRQTLNEAPFDFEQLISEVNTVINAQCEAKGLDYDVIVGSYTEDSYVGDVTKLQEILMNILGNAVKFTPSGGKVTLSIEQLRRVNQMATLRFTVTDTGVGIEEDFMPHLFDAFSQEYSSYTSATSGTGLGLAISKSLVDMMNGHIFVKSIKNVGSVFTVDVQLGLSAESRRYLDLKASMSFDKLRALVVDDDVMVCKSTENILRDMGLSAQWVASGAEAVELAASEHERSRDFDTIFIDWKMPDMDGIETTRRIRRIVGPEVTIIIMTAYEWRGIEAEAREAGVNMFMDKPLFQSTIVKAFEKVFLAANKQAPAPEKPQLPDLSGRRILLVEDHPLNVEVAKRLLERAGAEVTVAGNGLEAIELFTTAQDRYFSAILMDIRMPVMDGLTATRGIRNLRKPGSRDIPIIAMTANAFDDDVDQSLSAGMNAHLAKPIEPKLLFSTLLRLIKY